VAEDLKTLQRQAEATPPPVRRYVPPTPAQPYVPLPSPTVCHSAQPQHTYGISGATGGSAGQHVWACATCTFENIAGRMSCEMCGTHLSVVFGVLCRIAFFSVKFLLCQNEQFDSVWIASFVVFAVILVIAALDVGQDLSLHVSTFTF